MVVLEIYIKDAKAYLLYFKDETGTAIDITGDTIFFTVKINKTDPDVDALISKDITSHTDPTAGETQIDLTTSDTTIAAGEYYFDIKRLHGSNINTVVNGVFRAFQDVTTRIS